MKNIVCKVLLLALYLGFFVHNGETYILPESNNGLIIEPVIGKFVHGEGPLWHVLSQALSFVDTVAKKVCMYYTIGEELVCAVVENGPVGFAIPVHDRPGKFVVGSGTDFVLLQMPNSAGTTRINAETLININAMSNSTRWNDGKADSSGRFWGGTIGLESNEHVAPHEASLYRIDSDLTVTVQLSNVTNSNGLTWSLLDDTLYYIDSATHQIAAFDFDSNTGSISNKRIIFDLEQTSYSGILDGMTIDANGNLWVALYNGSAVLNIDPQTGEVLRFVKLPVSKVTSLTFGGPLLDTLYVTTSNRNLTKQQLEEQPLAGYVLSIKGLGIHGILSNSFNL